MLQKRKGIGIGQRGFGMIGMLIALALLTVVFIMYSQRYLDVLLNVVTPVETTQAPELKETLSQTQTMPRAGTQMRLETQLKQSIEAKMKGDDFYRKQIEEMQH